MGGRAQRFVGSLRCPKMTTITSITKRILAVSGPLSAIWGLP